MLTRTTSAVLSRRTSSLTLRVRGTLSSLEQSTRSSAGLSTGSPRFPLEIIETIVGFALSSYYPDSSFIAIAVFTQTSRALREIALRQYFRSVVIDSRAAFVKLWDSLGTERDLFHGINSFGWVRSLFAPSHIITRGIRSLGAFTNLRVLEISFDTQGSRTQDLLVNLLLDSFANSPAKTNMKKLAFTEIPRIDSQVLASIATTFPRLKTLELTSTKRIDFDCCLNCLKSSLDCARHSPIPDYSSTVEQLAVDTSFANSLVPLDKLENLYLGLYLSDTGTLEEHIAHSDESRGGRGVLTGLPSCSVCAKLRGETWERELVASSILAKTLPSLVSLQWDTLFAPDTVKKPSESHDEDGLYFRDDKDSALDLRAPYISVLAVNRQEVSDDTRAFITHTSASKAHSSHVH